MDMSVIIVNWNSAAFVRKCLASIAANAAGLSLEVLVVDNASYDGVEEIVRKEFPWAKFIQSPANLGFAGANNLGFAHSRGRNVLFLNPDTEVGGPALQRLLGALDSIPEAGIVGARLLNSDGSLQTSCVQAFPTLLNQVLDAEILRRRFPRSRLWGMRALFDSDSRPSRVDAVSGACLMVRREVFEKVGGFTPEYFMYSEDVDLCWKVRRAGWSRNYVPFAQVVHHGGGSTNKKKGSSFSTVMFRESRYRYFRRNSGPAYAGAYRLTMFLSAVSRTALLFAALGLTFMGAWREPVLAALGKWYRVLRWASALEGWAASLPAARSIPPQPVQARQ